ncbi:MAG: hypothetical protein ACLPT6_03075, partial [Desulfobaccales bacterium]
MALNQENLSFKGIKIPHWKRGDLGSSVRQGFCYESGSRDLFELGYARYPINSWNLQAISLSPLGGR